MLYVTAPEKTPPLTDSRISSKLPCDWKDVRMLTIQGTSVRFLLKNDREVMLEFDSADEISDFLKKNS